MVEHSLITISRAFTDPEIMDALLLYHIGVSWQINLRRALQALYQSKAWNHPATFTEQAKTKKTELLRDDGRRSVNHAREQIRQQMFFLTQLQS